MFLRKKVKHQQQNAATSEKVAMIKPTKESLSMKSTPLFARFASANTMNNGPNGSPPKPMVSVPMSLGMKKELMPSDTVGKAGSGRKDGMQRAGGQAGQPWKVSEKVDKPLPPTLPSEGVKSPSGHRMSTSGPVPVDPSRMSRKISTQKPRAADTTESGEPQSILSSRPSTTTRKSSIRDLHSSDSNSYSVRVGDSNDAPSDPAKAVRNHLISGQAHPTYVHGPTNSAAIGSGPSYRLFDDPSSSLYLLRGAFPHFTSLKSLAIRLI
ncbi:MAG: hypothetical protein NXY57DRAFT_165535 [Lentinula lateritia]|nr:MAG: hypothetical protein NXY57DRAFT_165535 [Lentinula lateritia]